MQISGPTKSVQIVVEQAQQKQIFAKIINTLNVAAHSKYTDVVMPDLQKNIEQFLTEPKKRSSKWISSCYRIEQWNEPAAQKCSVEYLQNNFKNTVLFKEAMEFVPKNAICIEISSHGLLQALLKRYVDIPGLSLMKMKHENNINFFLENIGKLYNVGGQPNISELYPKIEYPVSQGTPMLNSAVEWDHRLEFEIPKLPCKIFLSFFHKEFDFSVFSTI